MNLIYVEVNECTINCVHIFVYGIKLCSAAILKQIVLYFSKLGIKSRVRIENVVKAPIIFDKLELLRI